MPTHGKGTYFSLGGNNLSSVLNEVTVPLSVDQHESTTYGKNSKTYEPGLKDGTISISGFWDAATEAIIAGLLGDADVAWIYGPEGNSSSDRRRTGNCSISSFETGSPVGDLTSFSLELQIDDDVTFDTF